LLPAPDNPTVFTRALAVSGDWAAGVAGDGKSSPIRAVRWDLRTFTAQWVDQLAWVLAVNRYGWMAGTDARRATVLLIGDQAVPLPMPPNLRGGDGLMALVLSDNGRTVGGQVLGNVSAAVRWSCS
jgi:hypothetical protein